MSEGGGENVQIGSTKKINKKQHHSAPAARPGVKNYWAQIHNHA